MAILALLACFGLGLQHLGHLLSPLSRSAHTKDLVRVLGELGASLEEPL